MLSSWFNPPHLSTFIMQAISFYPGPSKVYPEVSQYMQEAIQEGVLSLNHRSQEFMRLCESSVKRCKEKLRIPADYTLFFASSATECWEVIGQSLIEKDDKIYHLYQGAFGKKWADYTHKLVAYRRGKMQVHSIEGDISELGTLPAPPALACLTPSETSNGSALSMEKIKQVRTFLPDTLLALDVTSCLGGIDLAWEMGDIWFASVQKCLGLPAGLAVCILSPHAVAKAYTINERTHYNSLVSYLDHIQKFQTPYTPNVLGIYLLNSVMAQIPTIKETAAMIQARARAWYNFFEQFEDYKPLACPDTRSSTVICISATVERIDFAKQKMKEQNIILGNGYDKWKLDTFRVANFPAITEGEIELFKDKFTQIANMKV